MNGKLAENLKIDDSIIMEQAVVKYDAYIS